MSLKHRMDARLSRGHPIVEVPPGKPIKLVVWEFDETLWTGAACRLIQTLDERGILQSIVSRSSEQHVRAWMRRMHVADYFLVPHFGAHDTSLVIKQAAEALNIGLDATLLIADSPLEREKVTNALPEVRSITSNWPDQLAQHPLMGQSLAALEPRPRRLVYLEEQARARCERDFPGSRADFLATLEMQISLAPAQRGELHRLRELANRTNQLCVMYTDQELERLRTSPNHRCRLVSLQDRFGDCGKVGLVLMEISRERWTLQLLLFSCRVMPRGVNTKVLHSLLREARAAGVRFLAEFKPTSKNQSLLQVYEQAGFERIDTRGDRIILEHSLNHLPEN